MTPSGKDIVFHIGLPKTGTTFLQRHVLSSHEWAIVPNVTVAWKRKVQRMIVDAIRGRGRFSKKGSGLARLATRISAAWERHLPECGTLVISNEAMTDPPFFNLPRDLGDFSGGRIPVLDFLDRFANDGWCNTGAVKVIMTIRGQPRWLASLYAQRSHKIPNASQKDFDMRVRHLLRSHESSMGGFLEWGRWAAQLDFSLGKENTTILLQEDMATAKYWDQLADVVSSDAILHSSAPFEGPKANARHVNGSWQLRPRSVQSDRAFHAFYELAARTRPVEQVLAWASTGADELERRLRRRSRMQVQHIGISPDLAGDILAFCTESNNALSERLGRNLTTLGY